jgi:hypothetical protein
MRESLFERLSLTPQDSVNQGSRGEFVVFPTQNTHLTHTSRNVIILVLGEWCFLQDGEMDASLVF